MKILLIASLFCFSIGCQNPAANPLLAGPVYPMELHTPESLSIQVVRSNEYIDIINSTATTFSDSTLWINQRYSAQIPSLHAGKTIRVNLWTLRDSYGEQFNAGGFWRTGTPSLLILAEIQAEAGSPLIGLIVVGED
mgnify:CR=1 FL=1